MLIGDIFPLRNLSDRCKAAAHVLCDMDAEFMTLHKRYQSEAIPVNPEPWTDDRVEALVVGAGA